MTNNTGDNMTNNTGDNMTNNTGDNMGDSKVDTKIDNNEISLKNLYERIVRLEVKMDNIFETGNNDARRFTRYASYALTATVVELILLIAIYWGVLHG